MCSTVFSSRFIRTAFPFTSSTRYVLQQLLLTYDYAPFCRNIRHVNGHNRFLQSSLAVCAVLRQSFASIVLVPYSVVFFLHAASWLTIVSIYSFLLAVLRTPLSEFQVPPVAVVSKPQLLKVLNVMTCVAGSCMHTLTMACIDPSRLAYRQD